MSKRQETSPSVKKRREEMARKRAEQNQRIRVIGGALLVVVLAFIGWQIFRALSGGESSGAAVELSGERPLAQLPPAQRDGFYEAAPEMMIDPTREYEAVITMAGGGEIRLRLFADLSPMTVNNFVFLATQGFYDGVTFHRVIDGFVAQGGDPTGTGRGGPGYRFADEVDNGLLFDRPGVVAMANSGPNTNGSQFFITYQPLPTLDGGYSIFGELIDGQDVLDNLTRVEPSPLASTAVGDVISRIDIVENN